MKIMIEIDEERYEDTKRIASVQMNYRTPTIEQIVANGTPLEKHDEKVIKKTVESIWGKPPYTELLDKIRAEIDEQIKYNTYFNSDMSKGEIIAFEWVKRKIDEYTKGEQ